MFFVHRSDDADSLLAALGRELADNPLASPMAAELICVPSKGIERWISQGLADHIGVGSVGGDGISANIDFRQPGALISDVIDRVAGVHVNRNSWQSANLLWAVAQAVDANDQEQWLELVAKQISAGALEGRTDRMATMQYIANLFDRYHWQRPDMVLRWLEGEDADAGEGMLDAESRWQPRLWREVRALIDSPSPPEVLDSAKHLLESRSRDLDLPERISIFGVTRLPLGQLQLLRSLAEVLDVHLYVLHPSPALWTVTAGHLGLAEQVDVTRRLGDGLDLIGHPLLSSWSRDARELQVAIASLGAVELVEDADAVGAPVNDGSTLLERLQADIRRNQSPDYSLTRDASDRSVQIHSCHGPARQVEVLRDAILHACIDDESIEPRDIVVMCPDIETFAPHINATFASLPELRIRLADRAFSQTNPYMAATAQLLSLVAARCSSTEVLSLLSSVPVRTKFSLSDDDLAQVHDWVERSGVRWGLSKLHREVGNWGASEANTWRAGVQRLVLGVAMADDDNRLLAGVRPLGDVESTDVELVGKLAEFVAALETAIERLGDTYTVTDGLTMLGEAVDSLMACSVQESWQRASMFELLDDLRTPAESAYGAHMLVSINEFRDLFADELVGRPSRTNFRSGGVTFCTLTPMRSVPHRVVCLLGMDDGVFPRVGRGQGDDVTRVNQRIGDYDPRSEDRQLLLDAVMAAQQRLIVTFSGRDERTNEETRPSVPVDELITVVNAMNGPGSESMVTEHPLQGFDTRNFVSGALMSDRPWSFDAQNFDGSRRRQGPQLMERLFMEGSLPALTPAVIDLDDLIKFVRHPIKSFFQSRLRLVLEDYDDDPSEEFPTEIDSLLKWSLGTELLAELERSNGEPQDLVHKWSTATIASGRVPPGKLSLAVLRDVARTATSVDAARRRLAEGPASPVTVVVPLPDLELEVRGVVPRTGPAQIVQTTFSKVTESRVAGIIPPRLKAVSGLWVPTLALACVSDEQVQGVIIGKGSGKEPDAKPEKLVVTSPDSPTEAMAGLVELYLNAMEHPSWLFGQTSLSFASADARRAEAVTSRAWTTSFNMTKEDEDPYHLLAYGKLTLEDLLVLESFREGARQMWNPVLARLAVSEVADD